MDNLSSADTTFTINIEIDSEQSSFTCRPNQTVLDAAAEADVTLPSSCLVGMCCSCAALLKEGSVEMEEAMGLKSEMQEKGYVLLCQSYPKSDLNVLANQEEAVSSWDNLWKIYLDIYRWANQILKLENDWFLHFWAM